jgi:hypothetical protein
MTRDLAVSLRGAAAGLSGARAIVMPVFQYLLQRWGLVRLDRYGLVRTADGRILTTRPKILDDGKGGRIVGWQDGDPAPAELAAWEPPPRQPAGQAAKGPVTPAVSEGTGGRSAASSAAVMTGAVAAEAAVDEDDWEWVVKLARARVMAVPAAAAPPVQPADKQRAAPNTVIPVPPLPAVDLALHAGRLAPVVRPSPTLVAQRSPSRFPKGTSRLTPASSESRPAELPQAARVVALPGDGRRRVDRR